MKYRHLGCWTCFWLLITERLWSGFAPWMTVSGRIAGLLLESERVSAVEQPMFLLARDTLGTESGGCQLLTLLVIVRN